jgi:hypothetical protein
VQWRRWALIVGGAAIAIGCAVACLPDLVVAPVTPPPLTHPCGDGFTDLDGGEQCDPGANGIDGGALAVGCTGTCTIACEGKVGANGHCYFRAPDNTFAGSPCGPSAHIVTIASQEELSSLVTVVPESEPFWVGLLSDDAKTKYTSVNDEPGWSGACAGCFAIPASDAGFVPGAPTSPCVTATLNALVPWAEAPCDAQHHVVCEREPPGSLSDPCADFTGTGGCVSLRGTKDSGKRYLFVSERATASEAERQCRKLSSGRLVVFESREEREELMRELAGMTVPVPPARFWIGLARSSDAGWTWDDGTPAGPGGLYPLPWADSEPKPGAGAARAFADRSLSSYDRQLAHVSDQANTQDSYVCQYR